MAPFINLFNALGKVKFSFTFMLIWTIMTWVLTPLLSKTYGLYGFPLTHLIVSMTFVFVVLKARRLVEFDLVDIIYKFITAAAIMVGVIFFAQTFLNLPPLIYLFSAVPIAALIYYLVLRYAFNVNIQHELKELINLRKGI